MTHDIEQNTPALSPTRRTVLTGAAWTLPVIAAATITPMAAASNAPVLTFDKSTYNGTACGTITGAYITVTVNNVATAGKSVTTTLSGGYKFSDGTTTNTQVSGSNGRVNLPAISVPSIGGGGTATASSTGASTTSSSMSAPPTAVARRYTTDSNSQNQNYFSVPANSTPIGGLGFLTPAGDLYFGNTKVASNVAKAFGGIDFYQHYVIEYVSSADGLARRYTTDSTSQYQNYFSVPTNSTPVGGQTYLTPAGDLYFQNTKVASNVAKAFGGIDPYQHYAIEYTNSPAC